MGLTTVQRYCAACDVYDDDDDDDDNNDDDDDDATDSHAASHRLTRLRVYIPAKSQQ